jgi:hypothetical protein
LKLNKIKIDIPKNKEPIHNNHNKTKTNVDKKQSGPLESNNYEESIKIPWNNKVNKQSRVKKERNKRDYEES